VKRNLRLNYNCHFNIL